MTAIYQYVIIMLNKSSFIILCGVILLLLSFIDNIVMSSFLDSIVERYSSFNLYAFMSIVLISIASQALIFYSIRKTYTSFNIKITKSSLTFQILLIVSICANITLFSYLIIQMIHQRAYDSGIFKSIIFSSYSLSLIYIGFLIQYLLSWYKTKHSIIMLLYCLAFSVYLINEVCSILILTIQLEGRPEKISFVPNPWDSTSLRISSFTDFYKMSSIISFSITWLATSLLVYHYSRKIGKRKFWLLASLPLIYYLGNIDLIRSSIFNYLIFSSPYLLSVMQILLGGAKQVGGFFFALAFITISKNVDSQKLKYYLAISATGMMLLFSSNQISLIQIIPYPPFGLVTISLITISSFLVLIGLHSLAYSMAHDKQLLENARKIVKEKVSKFLYDIGSAQWQKDIDNTITTIMSSRSNDDDYDVPPSLTEEEMKSYVDEVLKELKRARI
jgi:hypothetical protein